MTSTLRNSDELFQEILEDIEDGNGHEVIANWDSIIVNLSREQAEKIRLSLLWNDAIDPNTLYEGSEQIDKIFPNL